MPIKDFDVGNPASVNGTELNRYLNQQQHVRKLSTETLTSSTTPQNDDELFLPLAANTLYWFQAFIQYDGLAGDGLKIKFTAPSGTVFTWVGDYLGTGATGTADNVSRGQQSLASSPAPGSLGPGTPVVAVPKGLISVGSNSGTLRLQWAQNTSSGTAMRVFNTSIMMIRKLNP